MTLRIFLAGATGAIGRRLAPLLVAKGYRVAGATRSAARAETLRAAGVDPVVVDVFDADALCLALRAARPDVVVHQLTDLPAGLDPARMAEAVRRNARIRDEGTRNLVQAAGAAGAARLVAQSIAWAYAPGRTPHGEDDPLDLAATGDRGVSVRGVAALEALTLHAPLRGLVLRYGRLYGPGTGVEARPAAMPLHVDAAAYAALCAVERGAPGAYNVAEPDAALETGKATRELGWRSDFRLPATDAGATA
jgi:nucleoside-diphosphate-sugar epimerase